MDVIDLYRAHFVNTLEHQKNEAMPPHLSMVMHNDLMYMSHFCRTGVLLLYAYKIPLEGKSIDATSYAFQSLAKKMYAQQIVNFE